MSSTLTAVATAVGGLIGPEGTHPDLATAARAEIERIVTAGRLTDGQVIPVGGSLLLVLTHEHGEAAMAVDQIVRETISTTLARGRGLGLPPPTDGLLPELSSEALAHSGASVVELTFDERPDESVVLFAGAGTSTGAFNLPLYKIFADPFNTAGLVLKDGLHEGNSFEVHDTMLGRKAVFITPEESYDLLTYIGIAARFVVRRTVSRRSGEVVAAASTNRVETVTGGSSGIETPLALVRCEGSQPTTGEVLEPFAMPALVEGFRRGTHLGPWMPVRVGDGAAGRFDGPSRAIALGYQVAGSRLVGPRDLFDHPSFDRARDQANLVADLLRRQGVFEPHRLPMEEAELHQLPAVAARSESRWVENAPVS